jgi:hypothetical protein
VREARVSEIGSGSSDRVTNSCLHGALIRPNWCSRVPERVKGERAPAVDPWLPRVCRISVKKMQGGLGGEHGSRVNIRCGFGLGAESLGDRQDGEACSDLAGAPPSREPLKSAYDPSQLHEVRCARWVCPLEADTSR